MNSDTLVSRQTVLDRIKQIALAVTNIEVEPESVRDNANLFEDVGLDSTSVVDLVLRLEEEFAITLPEEELELSLFQNISVLADYVEAKTKAQIHTHQLDD